MQRLVLALWLVAAACGGSAHSPSATSSPPSSTSTTAASAVVDASLSPGRIAVAGPYEVGTPLTAHAAADLDGAEWGWHRCNQVPTCVTIQGATGPSYTPTAADAWQVLRVIAVKGIAHETVVGPIVNPRPKPFDRTLSVPVGGAGRGLTVAPGRLRLTVTASCPVTIIGAVKAAVTDDGPQPQTDLPQKEGRQIDIDIETVGGDFTFGFIGDCETASVRIQGAV